MCKRGGKFNFFNQVHKIIPAWGSFAGLLSFFVSFKKLNNYTNSNFTAEHDTFQVYGTNTQKTGKGVIR